MSTINTVSSAYLKFLRLNLQKIYLAKTSTSFKIASVLLTAADLQFVYLSLVLSIV